MRKLTICSVTFFEWVVCIKMCSEHEILLLKLYYDVVYIMLRLYDKMHCCLALHTHQYEEEQQVYHHEERDEIAIYSKEHEITEITSEIIDHYRFSYSCAQNWRFYHISHYVRHCRLLTDDFQCKLMFCYFKKIIFLRKNWILLRKLRTKTKNRWTVLCMLWTCDCINKTHTIIFLIQIFMKSQLWNNFHNLLFLFFKISISFLIISNKMHLILGNSHYEI